MNVSLIRRDAFPRSEPPEVRSRPRPAPVTQKKSTNSNCPNYAYRYGRRLKELQKRNVTEGFRARNLSGSPHHQRV